MLEQGRSVVGAAVWEKVAPLLPGKASDPGATARDNRLFLEAVLWRVRAGAPSRDPPGDFGRWNSVFQRFRRWMKGGVFERVFACLSGEPDFEYALIDGTIVTAHHKASGARGDPSPGHRTLARWPDHQDRRPGRRARQSGALRAAARPATRHHRRAAVD